MMTYRSIFDALPEPDFSLYTPLTFAGQRIGYINKTLIPVFEGFPKIFQFTFGNILGMFSQEFVEMSVGDRSWMMAGFAQSLKEQGLVLNWRDELFSIYLDSHRENEIFQVERGVVPLMALQAHGVHLNGFTLMDGEPHIWVGKRSADRVIAPLKYDQLVAGGLPINLSLKENLYKEAEEEASIPKDLVEPAEYVGQIQYMTADEIGIRNDVLHCYDLCLPEFFTPLNQDGEVEGFECLSISEVIQLLKSGQFKPNTAWVMLDFLLRHDWLPVNKTEHQALMNQLHSI